MFIYVDAASWSAVRIPAEVKVGFLHQIVQIRSGSHLAFCLMGTNDLSRRFSYRGVMLITHFRAEPRLGMTGAIPLLPPLLSWRGQGELNFYQLPVQPN